jgi:hypothetical protein
MSEGGTDLPGGLSRHCCVQPCFEKFSPSRFTQINFITPAVHPTEGRIAIVTDAGLDAMDAGGAADEAPARGRQSRVVLTPRRWRQVGGVIRKRRWQESPVTGESAK